MGQGNSKRLFTHILRSMLKTRGIKTSEAQLLRFLEFVVQICPWFPEEGTLNLETWEKVREHLQGYYDAHGPSEVPVDTFSLWNLVRDVIDPRHKGIRYSKNDQPKLDPPWKQRYKDYKLHSLPSLFKCS